MHRQRIHLGLYWIYAVTFDHVKIDVLTAALALPDEPSLPARFEYTLPPGVDRDNAMRIRFLKRLADKVLPGPGELYELSAVIRGEATKRLRAAKPRLFSPVSESDGASVKGH
jgi:hypothetical protein